ncbi:MULTISPECIES: hypothetical protein [Sphaerospermopsis]|jgi:hypothetical protein|uniref:Uncharacterized protein n=2 Tax=Sphaerospermopsis TaxID=752201 RepID=A0A479ZWK9_9CYAN|nr:MULTISPECIES: hypothetical protein [Sphaerospermopsis]MBD2145429.1 hypothetical protein [Sphaerospermopsis sp. FACHB-1194]MBE9234672.1 hypothetical protein [Sphaerospermopsis aphanizomenoides LEGE 00250]GCL35561.1 hypothetical protein SR1949_06570 [Sphaerospermopsis reniformis]
MKRLLIVYYSHYGDVNRATQSFTKYLNIPEIEIHWECIKPKADYPYPYKIVASHLLATFSHKWSQVYRGIKNEFAENAILL